MKKKKPTRLLRPWNATATEFHQLLRWRSSNYRDLLREGYRLCLWRDASASASPRLQSFGDRLEPLVHLLAAGRTCSIVPQPQLRPRFDLWQDASHISLPTRTSRSHQERLCDSKSPRSMHIFFARFTFHR
jgi:hypothetical protein